MTGLKVSYFFQAFSNFVDLAMQAKKEIFNLIVCDI